MNSAPNKKKSFFYVSALTMLLTTLALAAGCARKPWRQPLNEESTTILRQTIQKMQARDAGCIPCLDTEMRLFFKNHLQTIAVSGYLQIKQPSFVKFVSSNPFGQPLLALTSDGITFQRVSTLERSYLYGKVQSYGMHHDVPLCVLNGEWGAWLSGRLGATTIDIKEIRQDEQDRGVWVTSEYRNTSGPYREHLLVDPQKKLLLGRILTDMQDTILANVSYSSFREVGGCQQPENIAVTDLDFGAEIRLDLTDTREVAECPEAAFSLPKPNGFAQQYLP
jgi:hypothetical protein